MLFPLTIFSQWNLVYYTPNSIQPTAISVISPDTAVFVSYTEGKIYRTIDGGDTWWPHQTVFTSSWFLDVHFPSKLVGYACGGTNFGLHTKVIAKTIDGGATWDSLTSNTFSGYNFEKIHFINEDIGFVSGDGEPLLKTTDGGNSFAQTSLTNTIRINEIFFHSLTKGFVGTTEYIGQNKRVYSILQTSDLGASWTVVYADTMTNVAGSNQRQINEIFFSDIDHGYAVGGNGLFLKTTDGGATWTTTIIPPLTNFTALSFTSNEIGYINNAGSIYKTIDGGDNWTVQNISPLSIIGEFHFTNDSVGYAIGSSGIYKTTNGGNALNLDKLEGNSEFKIFPNPFSNKTTINTEKQLMNANFIIYNSSGQEVSRLENISGQSFTFFRENLPAGIYYAHLKDGNDVFTISKMMVFGD